MTNVRDANGWRVPHPETRAYQVYELMLQGKSNKQIAIALDMTTNCARQNRFKIKNPEVVNATAQDLRKR